MNNESPMTFSALLPDRLASPRRRRLLAVALLLGTLLPARGGRAQAPTPAPTPAPMIRSTTEEVIPLNEDPNDPSASNEERLRRQKLIIMKRIQARQKALEEARQREEQAQQQQQQQEAQSAAPAGPGAVTPPPADGQPPQPNQPAPPAAGQTPPAGQAPPAPGGAAPGGAAHEGQAGAKGKAAALKQIPSVTMYLTPATITARVGERFSTQCNMLNIDHLQLDGFELDLSYPAHALKLVSIHQDKVKPMILGQPECTVDQERGTLHYRVRLMRPANAVDIKTLTLVWEALAPIDFADISLSAGEKVSKVFLGSKILSESATGAAGAVMGALVRIDPSGAAAQGYRYLDLDNSQLTLAGFPDQRKLRPPSLWIRQPENEVLQPDQWLVVDLGVNNPDHVVFDEVRLAAAYDPTAVEIADADRGNWISDGVNLLDGPFHQDWPWDRHFKNIVDPARGVFYYRMGMSDLREQPSGTIARLFVRVKRPLQAPLFTWVWSEATDLDAPGTGVYLFNRNLYAKLLKGAAPQPTMSGRMPAFDLAPGMEKADPSVYRFKEASAKEKNPLAAKPRLGAHLASPGAPLPTTPPGGRK